MDQLTKFQTWILFMLYEVDSKYTSQQLLRKCCDTAILDLEADNVMRELEELESMNYIYAHQSPSMDFVYTIQNNGVLYVKKVCAVINEKNHIIRKQPSVIDKQDEEIKEEINNNKIQLPTLLRAGVKNIGPIIDIINIFLK